MESLTDIIYPTVQDIINSIYNVLENTIDNLESYELDSYKVVTSHVVGTKTDDTCSFSVSFALSHNPYNDKTLNFFIVQNTKNADVSVVISSGERDGLKILYKSINKYPIIGIEKYLPSIVKSTIKILQV